MNLLETFGSDSPLVSTTASTVADILGSEIENFDWSFAREFFLELTSLCCGSFAAAAKLLFELLDRSPKLIALTNYC